eukprot:TRINITY_DN21258_c0_g1_i1.p1 TRINITY_DN21258_c0_g1~~TRINITY_DN21258_c0_g1_i1.p1  ORF type:complete len:588 (+),score=170.76 TRINITY_DN21258_c0_g1_i1:34-1797(+)
MSFQQTPGRFNANDFKSMLSKKTGQTDLEKQKVIKSAPKRQEPKIKKQAVNKKSSSGGGMLPPGKPANRSATRYQNTPYKDRAAERQAGGSSEYADDEKLLNRVGLTPMGRSSSTPMGMGMGSQFLMTPAGRVAIDDIEKLGIKSKSGSFENPEAQETEQNSEERQNLINEEIEKSKLLGGDDKHTHLVKGVDFAMLAKERARIQEQEVKRKEEEAVQKASQQELLDTIKKSVKKVVGQKVPRTKSLAEAAVFKTTLGRDVFNMIADGVGVRSLPRLAGRSFVFDLSADAISDVPRTSITSSLLGSKGPVMCKSSAPEGVLQNISYIIDQRSAGAYGTARTRQKEREAKRREELVRREKEKLEAKSEKLEMSLVGEMKAKAPQKEEKKESEQKPQDDESEGGIFSDEGGMSGLESSDTDSDSEEENEAEEGAKEGDVKTGGFFGDKTVSVLPVAADDDTAALMADLEPVTQKPPPQQPKQTLERLPQASSAYGECFPDTYGGPDLEGFAAGLNEVDEVDIEREELDDTRLDKEASTKEMNRKKQSRENQIQLELKRMEMDSSKKRTSTPPQNEPKRQKLDARGDPLL